MSAPGDMPDRRRTRQSLNADDFFFKVLIFRRKLLTLEFMARPVQRETGMWQQFQPARGEPAEWLGDWHPLVEQLGSTNGLVALGEVSAAMQIPTVHDLPSLRRFLERYQRDILLPHELP